MQTNSDEDYYIIPSVCTYRDFLENSLDDSIGDKFFEMMRAELMEENNKNCKENTLFSCDKTSNTKKTSEEQNLTSIVKPTFNSRSIPSSDSKKKTDNILKIKPNHDKKETKFEKTKSELLSRKYQQMCKEPLSIDSKSKIIRENSSVCKIKQIRCRSVEPIFRKVVTSKETINTSKIVKDKNSPFLVSEEVNKIRIKRVNSLTKPNLSLKSPSPIPPSKLPASNKCVKRGYSEPPKVDRSCRTGYNLRQNVQKPEQYRYTQECKVNSSLRNSSCGLNSQFRCKRAGFTDSTTNAITHPVSSSKKNVLPTVTQKPLQKKTYIAKDKIIALVERLSQPKHRATPVHKKI